MKTKLVYGVGVYNAGIYLATTPITNKITKEYKLWSGMLERCQVGGFYQSTRPSYIGCQVHQDFIKFQEFAEWCNNQIGFGLKGWDLDKDILIQNNKVYGPDTCIFVPSQINKLLTHNRLKQGMYPTGVYKTASGRYLAICQHVRLGLHDTPDEASNAYKVAKLKEIHHQATIYKDVIDPRGYAALMDYSFE